MSAVAIRHPGELRWETRLLAVVTATLVVFGIASSYGAASFLTDRAGVNIGMSFALKQLSGAVAGGILLLIAARMDYHHWRRLAWPLLGITVVALLIPLLPFTHRFAPSIHGARRWIDVGPVNFQPSELARLAVVVWAATLAAKKGDQLRDFKRGVLPFVVVVGFVSLLIFLEPNLSMATLVAFVAGVVLFTAGAKIGHFLLLGGIGTVLIWHKIVDTQYRAARLLTFLNRDEASSQASFQITQSLVGMGSGRIVGVGFGAGQQKLGYLPFGYSDFLFSVIGEEWGFIGVCVVVFLFGLFVWLGFRIARTAPDALGQYLAAGITSAVGITAFLHMAVTLGLMPTTGLTLPFMSYGRSSLIMTLLGTGILISVGRQRGKVPVVGKRGAR